MPVTPQCTFYLYTRNRPINPQSDVWQAALPQDRRRFDGSPAGGDNGPVSHGMYFEAVHTFLSAKGHEHLLDAVSASLGKAVKINEIDKIDVVLAKHGEYYHPSRIEIQAQGHHVVLVLNVAVSPQGRACLQGEYDLLHRLNQAHAWSFIPRVYAAGDVKMTNRQTAAMFLGQWFENFHEFHLTRHPQTGRLEWVVWHPEKQNFYLSIQQAQAIYEQASKILTAYFNLQTYEHILAWHHAAGDFVVHLGRKVPEVKLISVRQYAPLFKNAGHDLETLAQGLFVFLLNLSIRMRLDRCDGVKEVVWAPDVAVPATVAGFFNGLALQLRWLDWPQAAVQHIRRYMKMHAAADVQDGLAAVAARYDPAMPGVDLVREKLASHAALLWDTLEGLPDTV